MFIFKLFTPATVSLIFLIMALSSCTNFPKVDIGLGSNSQIVNKKNIANGLIFYNVKKGGDTKIGFYTLISKVISVEKAEKLTKQLNVILSKEKHSELINSISTIEPIENDPYGRSIGKLVQLGNFESIEQAKMIQKDLASSGVKLNVFHTSLRGHQGGLFDISILKLSPKYYKGQLISSLGNNTVSSPEKTSSIAHKANAIAAVNAGFFVFDTQYGILGDPAGISVIDGKLVSEAVNERPALLIRNEPNLAIDILTGVKTKQTISLDGIELLINGINRAIGKILNCGQLNEQQSIPAVHDHLCESNNEIIIYDDNFGELSTLQSSVNFSFFIDDNDAIYDINKNSHDTVPKGHYYLRAIGPKAITLKALVKQGMRANIDFKVISSAGELNLEKGMYLINGGPTLLIEGQNNKTLRAVQGWDIQESLSGKSAEDKNDLIDKTDLQKNSRNNFYHSWMVNRHPRTAVGITKNNDIYIVVVYGRNPDSSVGASVSEMADIMKSLQVEKAMNLDGGGSSIMIINGKATGKPSDIAGERAVGDAILFLPQNDQ